MRMILLVTIARVLTKGLIVESVKCVFLVFVGEFKLFAKINDSQFLFFADVELVNQFVVNLYEFLL